METVAVILIWLVGASLLSSYIWAKRKPWQEAADRLGLEFEAGGVADFNVQLEGSYRGTHVFIHVERDSGGRGHDVYTVYEASYLQMGMQQLREPGLPEEAEDLIETIEELVRQARAEAGVYDH